MPASGDLAQIHRACSDKGDPARECGHGEALGLVVLAVAVDHCRELGEVVKVVRRPEADANDGNLVLR
jgi:hypothetical protein